MENQYSLSCYKRNEKYCSEGVSVPCNKGKGKRWDEKKNTSVRADEEFSTRMTVTLPTFNAIESIERSHNRILRDRNGKVPLGVWNPSFKLHSHILSFSFRELHTH